nr:unnamed protein product [Spirometra erinaceieuropaei]
MQNYSAPLHRASSAQETATERNSQVLFSSDGCGGSGCFKLPSYCTQNPVPNIPENNQVRLLTYRGARLAAFTVEGRELICLPQAFELFLKHLVGGLHTVYTKLKRLEIVPVVCNVEQVRILRGLGAIQPGVNRCKLIAPLEFDVLYADCTTSSARPGRPSKRSAAAQFLVTGPPRFSEVCYVGAVAVTSAGPVLSPHVSEEKTLPFLSKCPRLDSPYSTMALPLRLPPPPPFAACFTSPLVSRSSFLVPPAPDRLLAGVGLADHPSGSVDMTTVQTTTAAGEDATFNSSLEGIRSRFATLPPATSLLKLPPDALISMLKLSYEHISADHNCHLDPPKHHKRGDPDCLGITKCSHPRDLDTACGCDNSEYDQPRSAELSGSVGGLMQSGITEVISKTPSSFTPTSAGISPAQIQQSTSNTQTSNKDEPRSTQQFEPVPPALNHYLRPHETVFPNGRAKWWCYLMTAAIMGAVGQAGGGPMSQTIPCLCPENEGEGEETKNRINQQAQEPPFGPLALTMEPAHRCSTTSDT